MVGADIRVHTWTSEEGREREGGWRRRIKYAHEQCLFFLGRKKKERQRHTVCLKHVASILCCVPTNIASVNLAMGCSKVFFTSLVHTV